MPNSPTTFAARTPPFPTILVANPDDEFRGWVVASIRRHGYIVLEARDYSEASEVVKIHSRPIHLLLADGSPGSRNLVAMVQPYRPQMGVLFVGRNEAGRTPDVLSLEEAVERVQEIINAWRRAARAC